MLSVLLPPITDDLELCSASSFQFALTRQNMNMNIVTEPVSSTSATATSYLRSLSIRGELHAADICGGIKQCVSRSILEANS